MRKISLRITLNQFCIQLWLTRSAKCARSLFKTRYLSLSLMLRSAVSIKVMKFEEEEVVMINSVLAAIMNLKIKLTLISTNIRILMVRARGKHVSLSNYARHVRLFWKGGLLLECKSWKAWIKIRWFDFNWQRNDSVINNFIVYQWNQTICKDLVQLWSIQTRL